MITLRPGASHPYGVQPSGNALLSPVPSCRPRGLGRRLHALSDELLLSLLGCLDGADLGRLAGVR
jgi:hypothetical protein